MNIIKSLDKLFFPAAYSDHDQLEQELARLVTQDFNTDSLLDVGCGVTENSPLKDLRQSLTHIEGVDIFPPTIEKNKKHGTYDAYHRLDVMEIDSKYQPSSFDLAVATDLVEHLTKEEGVELLNKMELIATQGVIVFTPNGYIEQAEYDDNQYQVHKSGWKPEDFYERGYEVIGINGWKALRGEQAKPNIKPESIGYRLSLMTNPVARRFPSTAFALLAWKKL